MMPDPRLGALSGHPAPSMVTIQTAQGPRAFPSDAAQVIVLEGIRMILAEIRDLLPAKPTHTNEHHVVRDKGVLRCVDCGAELPTGEGG